MSPQRIQLSRQKGFKLPENAVSVARPSKWGNPFKAVQRGGQWLVVDDNDIEYDAYANSRAGAVAKAVDLFEQDAFEWLGGRYDIAGIDVLELEGKTLACWCEPDARCHADVLLAYANAGDA